MSDIDSSDQRATSAVRATITPKRVVLVASDLLLGLVFVVVVGSFLVLPSVFGVGTPAFSAIASESAMAFGALLGYAFVRKLRLPWLSIGWSMVVTGMLVDIMDEFAFSEGINGALDLAQVIVQVAGYQLTALGLLSSYRTLESRFRRATLAEDAARRSQYDFQALFEEAPVGFWETDPRGVIVRANRAVHEILGLAEGQIVGQSARLLLWPAGNETAPDPDVGPNRQFQVRVTHRDGTPRVINVHQNPILGESANVRGTRDALVDVTSESRLAEEQKHLERQLRQMQKIETVGTLAGGIAHDFNNLLSPIIGYVDMALQELPRESALRDDLLQVGEAANRAKDLVSQILAFSRTGDQEARPVRVQDVGKDVARLLRHTLPTTIEIRIQLDPLCQPISGDPTKIHQVIMNLCTNAFHAMKEHGGVLTLDLATFDVDASFALYHPGLAPGPHVRLTVSDTGCGIPGNALDRIFDPFFTTKQPGEGTGLGLSVVHGIVTGYGGQTTVESTVGKGTSFQVYLPALATDGDRREGLHMGSPLELAPVGQAGEHILVVDDDARVLKVTHAALERMGFRVSAFSKPQEALERYTRDPSSIDLVLTDQTMPTMTGLQLLGSIRELGTDVPCVLMTGYSEALTEEALEGVQIDSVLMKPIDMRTLAETVSACMENGRAPAAAGPSMQQPAGS